MYKTCCCAMCSEQVPSYGFRQSSKGQVRIRRIYVDNYKCLVIAAGGGKQPGGVPVSGPVFPEGRQSPHGQRDIAVLGSFAAIDMYQHPLAVDVANL
jgi:hypothetical protein